MLVYRVENYEGRGPYTSGDSAWLDILDRHPIPENDGLDYINDDEFCGFDSLEKAKDWFGLPELIEVLDDVYSLAVREVEDSLVRRGGKQLLFHLKQSKLIESHPLDILLDDLYTLGIN